MSPVIDYHTTYMGSANDKCTLRIVSLDLDFLGKVQAWIDDNIHDGELSGGFSPGSIRPTDYSHNGRFSWSISCAQNRKGMKAKGELIERFFDGQRHRKDIDPATEERLILDKIAAGKAAAHKKEDATLEAKQYKTEFDTVYAVRQLPSGEYRIMCRFGQGEWTKATDPKLSAPCNCAESLQEVLDAEAQRKGWAVYGPADPCKECRCKTCADESCLQAHCDGSDHGMGCIREDGCYAPSEAEPENATEETPAPAPLAPESAAGAPALPRFDYSGLDEQTVNDLHLAERECAAGRRLAEAGLRRMADGVAIAHEALVPNWDNSKHGNRGEDTFRRWCESIGISKSAAYRLLQVAALFDNSSPEQQKILDSLSTSLLYAAAKPSAPAELVQAVKDGDITSHKQYKDLLTRYNAEHAAREQAEQERDEAATHIQAARDMQIDTARERDAALKEKAALARDCNRLGLEAEKARKDRDEAIKQRDGARDALAAAKLRGDKLKAENDALKARPIEAKVVDEEEIDRRAHKLADELTAPLREELESARAAAADPDQVELDARNAYDSIILASRTISNAWQSVKQQLAKIPPNQRSGAIDTFNKVLASIQSEAISCL